jgi:TonB family protein
MNEFHAEKTDVSSPTPEVKSPSRAAASLAAAMPLVMTLTAAVTLVVAHGPSGTLRLAQDAGWAFYAAGLTTAAVACLMSALLWLVGRDKGVPAFLSLGLAGLPWCAGHLGAMQNVEGALAVLAVSPMTVFDRIVAVALVEGSAAALVGAWGSSALAGGLALGLAIAALGQRATEKPRFGAVMGVVGALPVFLLAAYAVVSGVFGGQAPLYIVASVRACLALVLAALAVGVSPRGRAGALAASVGPVCIVAIVTAGQAAMHGVVREALRGLETLAPTAALDAAAVAVRAYGVGMALSLSTGGLLCVPSLLLAWWVVRKARIGGDGAVVGAFALIAVTIGFVFMAVGGDVKWSNRIGRAATPAWVRVERVARFEPSYVPATDDTAMSIPAALIGVDAVYPHGASTRLPAEVVATAEGRRALADIFRAKREELSVDALRAPDVDEPPPARSRAGLVTPALTLAFDAHVGAPLLRAVLDAAAESGARSVDLVGVRRSLIAIAIGVPDLARPDAQPFWPIAEAYGSVRVLLAHDVAPGVFDGDATRWHATVGAQAEGLARVDPREGYRAEPIGFELAWAGAPLPPREFEVAEPRSLAWLTIGEDATAQSLAAFVRATAAEGLDPIVVTTATPAGEDDAASGTPTAPRAFEPDDVHRAMRAQNARIRGCYERALARRPSLAGRLLLRFTIEPDGTVKGAEVAESTLDDDALHGCLLEIARGLRFPSGDPEGSITLSYPLTFAAQ